MNRAATFKNAHRTKVSDHTFSILHEELLDAMLNFQWIHQKYPYRYEMPEIMKMDPDTEGDRLIKILERWNKRKNKCL